MEITTNQKKEKEMKIGSVNLYGPASGGNKLALTTDGELKLFFIGVGSAFAAKNFQNNVLIIKGDTHIMVDFGMTGPQALLTTTGLAPTDIGMVLPTHSHADHVGGLECVALTNRYVGQRFMHKPKTKMVIGQEYQRILWDYTLRGGLEWNEEPTDTHKRLTFSDFFEVIRPTWKSHQPREIFEVEVGPIHLEMFRTRHIPEQSTGWETSFVSFGLMIDNKVFFSGDTQFDPELVEMYSHAKVMFHDVQFFPGAVHAPLEDLRKLPKGIKSKMLLMHYADNYEAQKVEEFAGWAKQGVEYTF
jgi:ribonuclease BN (tRNA processing enzyme)